MITTTKKIVYLVVMTTIVSTGCYASEGSNNGWPGGYASSNNPYDPSRHGITAFPAASQGSSASVVELVYIPKQELFQSQMFQQQQREQEEEKRKKEEQEAKDKVFAQKLAEEESAALKKTIPQESSIPKTQKARISALQKCTNSSGITKDIPVVYCNSTYLCQSICQTISTEFSRNAANSKLFVVRCGNTYKEDYTEDNVNSALIDFALFNTYGKNKSIKNINTSRFSLSVGDIVKGQIAAPDDKNSRNISLSISRNQLAALLTTGMLLKYGAVKTCLAAAGITMSSHIYVLPMMVGCSMFSPIAVILGGSFLFMIGFTSSAVLTLGGALSPLMPLLLLALVKYK